MEDTINSIIGFLNAWGFWQLVIILLIILLTALIKIPIKKAAENFAIKNNVDKSVITWTISLIPFILAFIGALILQLINIHWDVTIIDWQVVVKDASILGGAAIGVFEAFKKWVEASAAKKALKVAKVETAKAEIQKAEKEAEPEKKNVIKIP